MNIGLKKLNEMTTLDLLQLRNKIEFILKRRYKKYYKKNRDEKEQH